MRLEGKVALITGAAAGIGRACAEAYLKPVWYYRLMAVGQPSR